MEPEDSLLATANFIEIRWVVSEMKHEYGRTDYLPVTHSFYASCAKNMGQKFVLLVFHTLTHNFRLNYLSENVKYGIWE
jgi:hypothetical protein